MAVTNDQLIRDVERARGVRLEWEFIDCYGLYCVIHGKDGRSDRVNVYDAWECPSGNLRRMMLRRFLEHEIWEQVGD